MGKCRSIKNAVGFTLLELLCVMAIIAILAALLLPALSASRARAKRIVCINNLHQAGIAFQDFAHDHNGRFPMSVPANAGGSLEFASSGLLAQGNYSFSFRPFQRLSNELLSPKMLVCPADTREPAVMFARLANTNLSYFVGLGCDYSRPDSVLAGDRNLTNDFMTQAFIRLHRGWRWTVELHRLRGNLLFADGHVEEKNTPALTDMGADSFAKLAFPTLPSDGSPSAVSPAVPASSSPAKSRKERARSEPGFTFNNSGILVLREGSPSPSNQTGSSGSTPEVRPAAPPSPGVEVRIITNTTSEIQPPRVVEAPVEKPGPTREPGFSLFPPWVTTMFFDVAKIGMWTLCLLMLIAAAVCFFQLRSALRKNSSTQTKLESEDSQ